MEAEDKWLLGEELMEFDQTAPPIASSFHSGFICRLQPSPWFHSKSVDKHQQVYKLIMIILDSFAFFPRFHHHTENYCSSDENKI